MRGSYLHLIKIEMLNAVEYVLYIFFVISIHLSVVDQEFQQEILVECEKKKKPVFFFLVLLYCQCTWLFYYLFIYLFFWDTVFVPCGLSHMLYIFFFFWFFFFNFSLDGSNVTSVNCEAAGKVHSFISGNSSQVNKRLFYHFISLFEW